MARVQRRGRTEIVVEASLDAVWSIVSDVTRTGEWSHECREVRWLGGASAAAPGARFQGRNRAGVWRWGRICEVVSVEEKRRLTWRTVPTSAFPDSTVWSILLEPAGEGTRICQEFEVVHAPPLLEPVYAALIPAHRDRDAALVEDLHRLGDLAGSGRRPVSVPAPPYARRRLTRSANRFGVWLYRRSDGRLASGRRGVTVLLITVPGRRTGIAHSTCVRFLEIADGWVVWGTGSGSRHDPDWFQNLRAASAATVMIGPTVHRVAARELVGPERDEAWRDVVLARAPDVARYARRARRVIPLAVLTPR